MDFSLNEDQSIILAAIDSLLAPYSAIPADEGAYVRYSADIQVELAEGGFLAIARQDGYGPLEAALIAERVARSPWSVECAASMIVGPMLAESVAAPLALCETVGKPTRYLPVAQHICLVDGDDILHGPIDPATIGQVETVLAYPIGTFRSPPSGLIRLSPDQARLARTAWQVAVAAEAAGLMRGALDATVTYVGDRRQFGQPIGQFQAVQHRLAVCEQFVSASYLLAMRAAASMSSTDAATALTYVQHHMRTVVYDCHQFTGAMGLTLEYPLHLWTYRLKLLQGELGGRTRHNLQLSNELWPDAEAETGKGSVHG